MLGEELGGFGERKDCRQVVLLREVGLPVIQQFLKRDFSPLVLFFLSHQKLIPVTRQFCLRKSYQKRFILGIIFLRLLEKFNRTIVVLGGERGLGIGQLLFEGLCLLLFARGFLSSSDLACFLLSLGLLRLPQAADRLVRSEQFFGRVEVVDGGLKLGSF